VRVPQSVVDGVARLAYLAACVAGVWGLVELGMWRGWWVPLVVWIVGTLVSVGLAEDYSPRLEVKPEDPNSVVVPRRRRRPWPEAEEVS
jgi:hypothetical protein